MARRATYWAPRGALWAWLALAALLLAAAAPEAQARPRLPQRDEIMASLAQEGQVRVLVKLAEPDLAGLKEASRAEKVTTPARLWRRGRQGEPWADQAIAQRIGQAADQALEPLAGKPYQVMRRFRQHPWLALELGSQALTALEESDQVEAIYLDRFIPLPDANSVTGSAGWITWPEEESIFLPALNNTVGIVGADTAWAEGYTGEGWYVAILDTGIRSSHAFFAGKDIVEACFTDGDCPNGLDVQYGTGSAAHNYSSGSWDHGTHVAGIAAGHRADDSLNGVAKGADIMAIQVFSITSSGIGSWSSDQAAAMEYIYSVRATYPVAAVNMSLGGSTQYNNQSICDSANSLVKGAIDDLKSVGIATAIASGNSSWCGYIAAPACISSAMAVGNTTDADAEYSSSNSDSTLLDILAPGTSIYSSTADGDTTYESWTGTSMATPHVTGAWAVIRQNRPDDSVDDIIADMLAAGQSVTTSCSGGWSKPRLAIAGVLTDGCGYSLASSSQAVAATGETGSFGVTTGTGCEWTAASNDAWISITGGATGTGSGTVSFTAAANESMESRTGTITAAGRTFTVTQAACAWLAVSNDAWISITGGACGVGAGTVAYSVAANSGGAPRTGTITIAGNTFTVSQMGLGQLVAGAINAVLLGDVDLSMVDSDGDGISDAVESSGCTSSTSSDSDGDGLVDGLEDANQNGVVDEGETDPCSTDSDGDGLADGEEDANLNGVVDEGETDPTLRDSDGDGFDDGSEVALGTDPLDPASHPTPITGAVLPLILLTN